MTNFTAHARFLRYSPYKLRPLVDVIRGKSAEYALQWLGAHKVQGRWSATYATRRAKPIVKVLASAVANAMDRDPNMQPIQLKIADIRVDEGPTLRYFKPTARGSASPQRKRFSHISVSLSAVATAPVKKAAIKTAKTAAPKEKTKTTATKSRSTKKDVKGS
jgi:large subunit ribosomal protein L22